MRGKHCFLMTYVILLIQWTGQRWQGPFSFLCLSVSAGGASVVCPDLQKCLGGWIQEWQVWPSACSKGWTQGNGYEIISALFQKYLLVWYFPLGEVALHAGGGEKTKIHKECWMSSLLHVKSVALRKVEQPLSLQEYVFAAQNYSPTTLRKATGPVR